MNQNQWIDQYQKMNRERYLFLIIGILFILFNISPSNALETSEKIDSSLLGIIEVQEDLNKVPALTPQSGNLTSISGAAYDKRDILEKIFRVESFETSHFLIVPLGYQIASILITEVL